MENPYEHRGIRDKWESEKEDELGFWRELIAANGGEWAAGWRLRLDPEQPLQPYIAEHLFPPAGTTVRILDVGAGPLTVVGKKVDRYTIHITAIDPLADQYNQLLDEFNIVPVVRTGKGEVERLIDIFPSNHFDLVYVQNALDHSYDPIKGIWQLLSVAKQGGYVLLLHGDNEAEDADYSGLHQWNLCVENESLVIWNRESHFVVNDLFKHDAELTIRQHNLEENETLVIIKKLTEFHFADNSRT